MYKKTTNDCRRFVTIKVFLRLTKSTTPAPIGPKNIVGKAKLTQSNEVAIDEPVSLNNFARSKKFIIFTVT